MITLLEGMDVKHDTLQSGNKNRVLCNQNDASVKPQCLVITLTQQFVCLVANLGAESWFKNCISSTNHLKERNAPSGERRAYEK
jgi:hypothetical protein